MTETVEQMWVDFWQHVAPPHCEEVQRQEMKRAFFAGCHVMLQTVKGIGSEVVSEDAGVAYLERLEAELRRFQRAMIDGKA